MDLPHEIWQNIAYFIPPLVVQHLFTLNHTLFELAMEQRYRQVSLAYLTKGMLRMVARLQDPAVSKRVKILHLHPHFVKDLLESDDPLAISSSSSPTGSSSGSSSSSHNHSLRTRISYLAKNIINNHNSNDSGKSKSKLTSTRCRASSSSSSTSSFGFKNKELMTVFRDVLKNLTHVEEYYIMWCGEGLLSVGDAPVMFLVAPFLCGGSMIRKLSLDVSLDKMDSLVMGGGEAGVLLPFLEELDLAIRGDSRGGRVYQQQQSQQQIQKKKQMDPGDSSYSEVLVDCSTPGEGDLSHDHHTFTSVMKFIANHRHTIRSLSLSSKDPLDWSSLFFTLPSIPHLRHLSLSIPVIEPHLGDPSALAFFLNGHGYTLKSLALRVTELSGDGAVLLSPQFGRLMDDTIIGFGGGSSFGVGGGLDQWIQNVMSRVSLPILRTLDLTSSLIPPSASLNCIRQFTSSSSSLLHTLHLTGRYLTFTNLVSILEVFDEPGLRGVSRPLGTLRMLRLGNVTLSPELLDLVYGRLPYLVGLELLVRDVVPAEGDCVIFNCGLEGKGRAEEEMWRLQDESQIAEFLDRISTRYYADWALESLGLLRCSFPYPLETIVSKGEYWRALKECIPRLRVLT